MSRVQQFVSKQPDYMFYLFIQPKRLSGIVYLSFKRVKLVREIAQLYKGYSNDAAFYELQHQDVHLQFTVAMNLSNIRQNTFSI